MVAYAEKIIKLTVEIEKMEADPDDYNDADLEDVKIEIKQVEALIKELQLSISVSMEVFDTLRIEVSPADDARHINQTQCQTMGKLCVSSQITEMVETLDALEIKYDKNLVLSTRREYIKVQLQLEECERRHQELFNPNIGEPNVHIKIFKLSFKVRLIFLLSLQGLVHTQVSLGSASPL